MKAAIVGAGILGKLLAFALGEQDWRVTLFDFHRGNNCSEVAAGLLSPITELEKCDVLIYQLGLEALRQHWPLLLSRLDAEIYFRHQGSLYLSHPRDQDDAKRTIQLISHKLNKSNFYQRLSKDGIGVLEPEISHDEGFYFQDEGQIDSQHLLRALSAKIRELGVTILENHFVSEVQAGNVISKNKSYNFDCVFDCRGLGAKARFKDLRSVRGELLWLSAPDITITRPIRVSHPRYHLYIAPRPDNVYVLGASEIESEDESPISVQTTLELLTAAYMLNPKFSEARIMKSATHCRPTLIDHLPRIQYSDGLLSINGLYRHGYLIAPSLISEVLAWLSQGISHVNYPSIWEKCA